MNIYLVKTCSESPEQYDVYNDGQKIGYLRLRHGYFTAECPGPCDELVYDHEFPDHMQGSFKDEEQRNKYLDVAVTAVLLHWELYSPQYEIALDESKIKAPADHDEDWAGSDAEGSCSCADA